VVDDNEANRKLACDVLREDGFATLEAATATDGIGLAHDHLPDVILMDLRLPDLEGADALRVLAGAARTASIPVVAFSALPLEVHGQWLVAAGFAGAVEKPIDVVEFPHRVRRYCTRADP
jgi:two-component system, cell cycle response regulator DivK